MEQFSDLIKNRRSMRKFTDQELTQEEVVALLKAALMAPSSKRSNCWQFIVVDDKDMLEKLSHCKEMGAAFLADAAMAVVVMADPLASDVWMIGLGLSWLRKDWKTPTRSLTPAVLGSAVFYWCVLARFMENSSSWHRVAPTAMVWQLLAGLMFLSALARALYLPGTSDGRTLCAGGLAAFALCLCWELPTVLQTLVQEGGGALLTPTLLFRLGLCCVGALGALSAVRCTRTEQGA